VVAGRLHFCAYFRLFAPTGLFGATVFCVATCEEDGCVVSKYFDVMGRKGKYVGKLFKLGSKFWPKLGLTALLVALALAVSAGVIQAVTLRGDRWLSVLQLSGDVQLIAYQGSRRPAQRGDRLSSVGDIITTATDSSARLEVDQNSGFVDVAENSQVQVQSLGITSSGGRVTELAVSRGQVRLRIRPLNNPDSRLEIHTPAGVTGVRGTQFGITVQNDGQTGVATAEGSVVASAQGQSVAVVANTQSLIFPGEPPTPPEPLRDDPTLFVESLSRVSSDAGGAGIRISGRTDTVNLLKVNGEQVITDREGRFDVVVSLSSSSAEASDSDDSPPVSVTAFVITPLGTQQQYELVVP
jgi:hypothetical protein